MHRSMLPLAQSRKLICAQAPSTVAWVGEIRSFRLGAHYFDFFPVDGMARRLNWSFLHLYTLTFSKRRDVFRLWPTIPRSN